MFAFVNDTSGDVDTTEAKGEDQLQYVLTNSQRRRDLAYSIFGFSFKQICNRTILR